MTVGADIDDFDSRPRLLAGKTVEPLTGFGWTKFRGHFIAISQRPYRVNRQEGPRLAYSEAVRAFARTLSVAPLTYLLDRGGTAVVAFCFKTPEDAEVFAERFGGERLALAGR